MKYEIAAGGVRVPKIGFGCGKIGGGLRPDPSEDGWALAALRSALDLGYTHFDTAESYAEGHSEKLLGQAIRESGVPREALFITSKVSPTHLSYDAVLASCEASLRRLQMDYLDLYLIHWPPPDVEMREAFRGLNQLVAEGKTHHLGVSNFNVAQLQHSQALSDTPILTNQVPYSLVHRKYMANGVIPYCQANNILVTAYSPVRQSGLKNIAALRRVAGLHNATAYQIALAWLVQQSGVITIPLSGNPVHQAENLAAGEVVLTNEEMKSLNEMPLGIYPWLELWAKVQTKAKSSIRKLFRI